MNRFDKWPKEMVAERHNPESFSTLCRFDRIHMTIYQLALFMGRQEGWEMTWDSDNDSITCTRRD